MGPHSPLPSHEGHPSTSNKSATEVCAQMAKPTMKSLAGCIFFVKKLHGTLCHEVFGRLLVPNALKVACLDATIWPIEFLKTSLATAKFEHFFDFRLLVFSLRWPSREANWVKNPYLSQVSLETPIFGGFYMLLQRWHNSGRILMNFPQLFIFQAKICKTTSVLGLVMEKTSRSRPKGNDILSHVWAWAS